MSNTLVTVDMVTRAALDIAHEKLSFIGTINRDYDDSFAKKAFKIGDSLRIRSPNQFTRRTGSRIMNVQDQAEATQTLTVATQDGVDMRFNGAELALSIEEFSERYIEPAVSVLVAGVEGDVLADVTKKVYNTVGSAGTVVGTGGDIAPIVNARAKLNQYLAPKDNRRAVQLDSITMGSVVNGLKSLFHDGTQIKEAFREGQIARNSMADWYENEKTWTMTNGSDVACTLDTYTVINGDSDLTVTSFATPTAGMVFTIAGAYAVHPETKAAYDHLQQFTVLSGSTATNILCSPTIYLSGPKQNVSATPTTTAALTFWGSASTPYRQNLMYHKDAFTFVTADLPIMAESEKCVRRVKDGLALRVWKGSDIRNDEMLMRIDILYGWLAQRPEWACRISN